MAPNFHSYPLHKIFRTSLSRVLPAATLIGTVLLTALIAVAQKKEIIWSPQEKPIAEQFEGLRKLDDVTRVRVTKELALRIRQLPPTPHKLGLSGGLTHMATEGDFGRETL